jgi:hypothetical protein
MDMEEQPTVQMGGSSFDQDFGAQDATTPPTIPIDDVMSQQGWPPAPAQVPPYAPPPQPVSPPGYSPPPVNPPPAAAGGGATRMMGPPLAEPLLAWLAVVHGPGAPRGQVFSLQPETVVGRTAGEIVLANDPFVSSQHAKIRQEPSEEDPDVQLIVLYDMASANGSFAGSKDDYKDQQIYRHVLQDGDYLLIGETTLVFKKV